MTVNSIGENGIPIGSLPRKDKKEPSPKSSSAQRESVQISAEARLRQEDEARRISTVRANIERGLYNQPDVLQRTAEAILDDLTNR